MAYSGVDLNDRLFFIKLLLRWSGSVWQMLYVDLICFILIYIGINLLYRAALHEQGKRNFENFVMYVQKIGNATPLSFLLGFYVSAVIGRWWSVCMAIPWLNTPAFYVSALVEQVQDKKKARKLRLTIIRYMNLSWILCMRTISLQVHKRFRLPEEKNSIVGQSTSMALNVARNVTTLVTERKLAHKKKEKPSIRRRLEQINSDPQVKKHYGAMLTEEEIEAFVTIAENSVEDHYAGEYWIPLQWCTRLLAKSRELVLATTPTSAALVMGQNRQYSMMVQMINDFRGCLGTLTVYNDINIPLVYTQVVVIAVYTFFLAEIFTSQQINTAKAHQSVASQNFDSYIPIFSIFKFILFMGWFKTAICLMNPFGDDVNSIPTNEILDYNLKVGQKSGAAEDYMYPSYLADEGDPQEKLCEMLDSLDVKLVEDILKDDEAPANEKKEGEEEAEELEEVKDDAAESMMKAEEAV